MTPLEQYIYECAKEKMPDLEQRINSLENNEARYVKMAFLCDNVVDIITYDMKLKKFTLIEYQSGIGGGIGVGDTTAAYFDDCIIQTIDISEL